MLGSPWPDSSVISVLAWKTSIRLPSVSAKRIGRPEPVMKPGFVAIQLLG